MQCESPWCNSLPWWGSTCSSFEAPCVRTQRHSVCALLGLGLSSSVQLVGDVQKMWQRNHEGRLFGYFSTCSEITKIFFFCFPSQQMDCPWNSWREAFRVSPNRSNPSKLGAQQLYCLHSVPDAVFSTILMCFVCVLLAATTNAAMFAAWQSVSPSHTGLQSPHCQLWKVPVPSLTGLLATQAFQIWEQGQQGQSCTFRTRSTSWSFQRKELSSETTISRQMGRATCKRSQERAKEWNTISAFFQVCFAWLSMLSMLTCFQM